MAQRTSGPFLPFVLQPSTGPTFRPPAIKMKKEKIAGGSRPGAAVAGERKETSRQDRNESTSEKRKRIMVDSLAES